MANVLISLGGNIGDSADTIAKALRLLGEETHIEVVKSSRLYTTKAVGGAAPQNDFQNAAALLRTSLSPRQLLETLNQIETRLGRTRNQKWDARTIDLDILLFGDEFIVESDLVIPHRRMIVRQFVLEPAAEIAPEMIHSGIGWPVQRLQQHTSEAFPWFAISNEDRALSKEVFEAAIRDDAFCVPSYRLEETFDIGELPGSSSYDALRYAIGIAEFIHRNERPSDEYALLSSCSLRAYANRFDLTNLLGDRLNEVMQPKLLIKFGAPKKAFQAEQPILFIDPADLHWAAREINAAATASRPSSPNTPWSV